MVLTIIRMIISISLVGCCALVDSRSDPQVAVHAHYRVLPIIAVAVSLFD